MLWAPSQPLRRRVAGPPPASALTTTTRNFCSASGDGDTWSLVSGTSSFDVPSCASLALRRATSSRSPRTRRRSSRWRAPPSVVVKISARSAASARRARRGRGVHAGVRTSRELPARLAARRQAVSQLPRRRRRQRGARARAAGAAALAALEKALGPAAATRLGGRGRGGSDAGDDDAGGVASVGSVTTVRGWPRQASRPPPPPRSSTAIGSPCRATCRSPPSVLTCCARPRPPGRCSGGGRCAQPRVLAGPRPPRPRVISGGRRRGSRPCGRPRRPLRRPLGRIAEDAGSDSDEG